MSVPVAAQDYGIVLRVNERIATTSDYQNRRFEKLRAIQAAEELSAERRQRMLAEVAVSTMSDLFEELLMLSRADQLGLQVSRADLDRAVETTKSNFGIETEEEFQQALLSSGMTLERLRRNLSKSLLIQRLMGEEVQPRIKLEEEDLRRYYQSHSEEFQEPERLRLREVVLLESSGASGEDLRRFAEEIRLKLVSGENFEELVQPYVERGLSSSPVDLGWVEPGDLDRDLEEAVWSLSNNEVSQPIAGRGGLHVLVVEERQEARLRSFAEVEEEIRAREGERIFNDESQKYLQELESRAYVVANPPPEAAGFRASVLRSTRADDLTMALTAPLITDPVEPLEVEPQEERQPEPESEIPPRA